jgi:hypothetical protein
MSYIPHGLLTCLHLAAQGRSLELQRAQVGVPRFLSPTS